MKPTKRNLTRFPDDDNGNVLWELFSHGDPLTEPREIDFSCIFPSEVAAIDFAVLCLRSEFKVELAEVEEHTPKDGLDWEVTVYTTVIPTHDTITQLEDSLQTQAAKLKGRTAGWSSLFLGP